MTVRHLTPDAYGVTTRGLASAWARHSASGLELWLGWLTGAVSASDTYRVRLRPATAGGPVDAPTTGRG